MYKQFFSILMVGTLCLVSCNCGGSGLGGMTLDEAFPDVSVRALVNAAILKDETKVRSLVHAGADPNAAGKNGILPLAWVIANDQAPWDRTAILLENGADPNKKFSARTPASEDSVMYLTAGSDKPDLLQILLKHGGNPNITAEFGTTALMNAAEQGQEANIKILLNNGADINGHDQSGNGAPDSALDQARFDLVVDFLNNGYSHNLNGLAKGVEIRMVYTDSPYCEWKKKAVNILRDKGVKFPTINHANRDHDPCLPEWLPQK